MRAALAIIVLVVACLAGPSLALADPPANDTIAGAMAVQLDWKGLQAMNTNSQVVAASTWGAADVSSEDQTASCLGAVGFRSMWYSVSVGEASELQVRVSDDTLRYQAVVTIYDGANEVACDVGSPNKSDPAALATAYVTPQGNGQPQTYLIRVAEATNTPPINNQPSITVAIAGLDVTPPQISVSTPTKIPSPGRVVSYDATRTTDKGSGVAWATATWQVVDGKHSATYVNDPSTHAPLQVFRYAWHNPGQHAVTFSVEDFAGNLQSYRFEVYVHDTSVPVVSFTVVRVPFPKSRVLPLVIRSSEGVRVRLVVTQGRSLLWRGQLVLTRTGAHRRNLLLRRRIAAQPALVTTGEARDFAGNGVLLPTCVLEPMSGLGRCIAPN